jgi:hypothetical protein
VLVDHGAEGGRFYLPAEKTAALDLDSKPAPLRRDPRAHAARRYAASYAKMVEFVGRLHRAGVPVVAGTDNIAGFTLQSELEIYVQAGMTPHARCRLPRGTPRVIREPRIAAASLRENSPTSC